MTIDDRALDSLSVAPDSPDGDARNPQGDAGADKSITKRLQKNPDSVDARLDNGLDESMDGSDPVSISDPSRADPAPSSGYDDEAERQRDA
jgi:hypothetical protein